MAPCQLQVDTHAYGAILDLRAYAAAVFLFGAAGTTARDRKLPRLAKLARACVHPRTQPHFELESAIARAHTRLVARTSVDQSCSCQVPCLQLFSQVKMSRAAAVPSDRDMRPIATVRTVPPTHVSRRCMH